MKNRKEDQFDRILKRTLDSQADHVRVSPGLKYQIRQSINESEKEKTVMKIGKKQKWAVAVAAVLILGSITVAAAGKVTGYRSHSRSDVQQIHSYADVAEVEEMVRYPLKAVETFANGYALKEGHIANSEAVDSEGNTVDAFQQVYMDYEKDGTVVTLVEEQVKDYKKTDPTLPNSTLIECGDITLTYNADPYKFVPPDYEPTDEEKEAMAAKELYISYGADEITETEYHFLSWEQDNIRYLFMCYGKEAPGAEELTEMARELIEMKE